MASPRRKPGMTEPALDHLPDRLLVDIGLDVESVRRRGWTDYVRRLAHHIGPTRS